MSEVKTYDGHGEPCIPEHCYFVRKADYDAALAREAELGALFDLISKQNAELLDSEAALREELAAEKKWYDSEVDALQQRLNAADQRNDELVGAMENAQTTLASVRHLILKYIPDHQWLPTIDKNIEAIRSALKPTESGVSE